ncbi:MAG TPA: hypothetical protein VFZ66_29825 [Herpetosiphonaceae bacterium]
MNDQRGRFLDFFTPKHTILLLLTVHQWITLYMGHKKHLKIDSPYSLEGAYAITGSLSIELLLIFVLRYAELYGATAWTWATIGLITVYSSIMSVYAVWEFGPIAFLAAVPPLMICTISMNFYATARTQQHRGGLWYPTARPRTRRRWAWLRFWQWRIWPRMTWRVRASEGAPQDAPAPIDLPVDVRPDATPHDAATVPQADPDDRTPDPAPPPIPAALPHEPHVPIVRYGAGSDEARIVAHLETCGRIGRQDVESLLGVRERAAQNKLRALVEAGVLATDGRGEYWRNGVMVEVT